MQVCFEQFRNFVLHEIPDQSTTVRNASRMKMGLKKQNTKSLVTALFNPLLEDFRFASYSPLLQHTDQQTDAI